MHGAGRTDTARDLRYTPSELIDKVARTLDPAVAGHQIDLDPCAALTRRERFAAQNWTTRGLSRPWMTYSVFVNPPGSSGGVRKWAAKFAVEFKAENFSRGAFLFFNHDHSTKAFATIMRLKPVLVLLQDRWKFPDPDGTPFEVGRSQTLAFVGVASGRVFRVFDSVGYVVQHG